MSLKNDRWLQDYSDRYNLISPYVREQVGDGVISYGPSSFGYDARAAHTFKIFTDLLGVTIDPKRQDENAFHTIKVEKDGDFIVLPPNSYALTHTIETFQIPDNVTAICIGKSTYARCGIHVNVTPLEAGWRGQVTVEISNGTRLPVKIYAGEGIMQVLFFEGERPSVSYADRGGKYQDQKGVVLAKILGEEGPPPAKVGQRGARRA